MPNEHKPIILSIASYEVFGLLPAMRILDVVLATDVMIDSLRWKTSPAPRTSILVFIYMTSTTDSVDLRKREDAMVEEFMFAGIPGIVDRTVPEDQVWLVDWSGEKLGVIQGLALPRFYERKL